MLINNSKNLCYNLHIEYNMKRYILDKNVV